MAANKLALSTQVAFPRQAVADANATVAATTTVCAVTSLTASRTLTLPAASAYPVGLPLLVADESGSCSNTITISVATSGGSVVATLAQPRQSILLMSTGSAWVVGTLSREVFLALLTQAIASLPQTQPAIGLPWVNGGVVSLSVP